MKESKWPQVVAVAVIIGTIAIVASIGQQELAFLLALLCFLPLMFLSISIAD